MFVPVTPEKPLKDHPNSDWHIYGDVFTLGKKRCLYFNRTRLLVGVNWYDVNLGLSGTDSGNYIF